MPSDIPPKYLFQETPDLPDMHNNIETSRTLFQDSQLATDSTVEYPFEYYITGTTQLNQSPLDQMSMSGKLNQPSDQTSTSDIPNQLLDQMSTSGIQQPHLHYHNEIQLDQSDQPSTSGTPIPALHQMQSPLHQDEIFPTSSAAVEIAVMTTALKPSQHIITQSQSKTPVETKDNDNTNELPPCSLLLPSTTTPTTTSIS